MKHLAEALDDIPSPAFGETKAYNGRDAKGGIMTEIAETGGPAFPGDANDWGYRGGMSLRDYFAGQSLVGFIHAFTGVGWHNPNQYQIQELAKNSYLAADAMLKARSHPTPSSPSEMEQTA